MIKQTVLEFSDLRFLEITCQHCKTKIVLDLNSHHTMIGPCPGCNKAFDAMGVGRPVANFVEVYKTLTHEDQKAQFRVIVETPLP